MIGKCSDEQNPYLKLFKIEATQNFNYNIWLRFFCHVMLLWSPYSKPDLHSLCDSESYNTLCRDSSF